MSKQADDLTLVLDDTGWVATVSLVRPAHHNAQLPQQWEALARIGESLPDTVRVVVIRGEGHSFSAGLDLRMFSPAGLDGDTSITELLDRDDNGMADRIGEFQRGFSWLRRSDLVTVAAVQGHAIGAGFQLALACDIRVCADDVRFAMRETSLGLVPDLGGTHPLVALVGYSRALEICVTGRFVDAVEAREIGLATIVVSRAELDAAVADFCAAVLASAHHAVTATKQILKDASDRSYAEQLDAERRAQVPQLRQLAADSAMRHRATGNKPG